MNKSKKTVVLGASENPARYSYLAVHRLKNNGNEVIAIGKKKGKIDEVDIITGHPEIKDIDTITLYLNEQNQKAYYDYIFSLNPKRIIFNPGAENEELEQLARGKGIKTMEACTLVLLSTGQF